MVPSGPAYASISTINQVCPVTGSTPGSNIVSGDIYIAQSFHYYHSHIWRNYAIIAAYFIVFLIAYGLAVEFVPQVEKGRGDVLIFLKKARGTKNRKYHVNGDSKSKGKAVYDIGTEHSVFDGREKLDNSQAGCFTWADLTYEIPVKGGTKTLLTGIHGYVKPGTMTAMLGESGAGKTTLLNTLAGRTHTGSISGSIFMNGVPRTIDFAHRTGYVESQDVHLSQFTVRETLRFSAQLRQPQNVSKREKNAYVEEVIEMLGMGRFADAVVGRPGEGLGLEQRKRMAVS